MCSNNYHTKAQASSWIKCLRADSLISLSMGGVDLQKGGYDVRAEFLFCFIFARHKGNWWKRIAIATYKIIIAYSLIKRNN